MMKISAGAIMNRKKKINETLKKRMKKANAKLHKSNKPRYISKAERAKLEAEAAQQVSPEGTISPSETETTSTETTVS